MNTGTTNQNTTPPQARGRVGLAVSSFSAPTTMANIVAAEAAGVRQVWSTQITGAPDTLSVFSAAAVRTERVSMGVAIVPLYSRHPLALAEQALVLHDLAPGRLRLGIGPSHRSAVEGVYGIPMTAPMEHLREYVAVLRPLLWEGKVDYEGRFYRVKAQLRSTPQAPILLSALREGAFQVAGEISDGAISWMCPVPYLLKKALPALRAGAAKSGRPVPPLIAHVPVALTGDRHAVSPAAHKQLDRYAQMPFYANMFADAGFPAQPVLGPQGAQPINTLSEALIEDLVVSGDEDAVAEHLKRLLAMGLNELLVYCVPVADADAELKRLMHIIGRLDQ
jgi:alkanesulfonate monooxygenase SsuD/methylene tetrahydromethanopterin reductase-like flavin-dependent oxidoreductase (luciferase family)